MNSRERTELLKKSCMHHLISKNYSCAVEMGVDKIASLRADVIGLNLQLEIIIIEVKQSISDFLHDKKWRQYLEYCNKFYFGIPLDIWEKHNHVIQKHIFGTGAGVIVHYPNGYAYIIKKARRRDIEVKKKRHTIVRMAWRGGFSVRNTKIEAFILK